WACSSSPHSVAMSSSRLRLISWSGVSSGIARLQGGRKQPGPILPCRQLREQSHLRTSQQWSCTPQTATLEGAEVARLPMDAVPTPEPARTSEWAAAVRLIFHHLPATERRAREATALDMLQRGELDPQGLLVLRGSESLDGALICMSVPGASALIWPPGVGFH